MVIGGGILQIPLIQTASSMGIKTIVTDYNPDAYGLKICDYPVLMSTRDVDGTVRIAKEISQKVPIHGVMTVGTDASKTVAAVANALGLPGIKYEDAECATNKIKMRTRFKKFNVPCPDFFGVWSYNEALEAFKKLTKPVVVKPADNMGARGVKRIEKEEDLPFAFESAKKNSPSGEVVIEEYMDGDELSIDSLVIGDEVHICGVADRIIERAPYFIEIGHVMPSQKNPEILKQAVEVMKQGIKALGITIGAAKGDIKITSSGPKIVELAARLSGGFMSTYTFPYSTGINLMKAAIEVSFGQKPSESFMPRWNKVSIERSIIPEPGIIRKIEGIETAENIPGVKNVFLTQEIGDEVVSPTNNVEKAGHLIVLADNHPKAFEIAEQALKAIHISTESRALLTLEEVKKRAIERFNKACFACKDCNGFECKGKVPGMGGIGTGETFQNNVKQIRKYRIMTSYIHNIKAPDLSCDFFGRKMELPLFIAPITGAKTNMGGMINEENFINDTIMGAKEAGIIAMIGDGADPEKYKLGIEAIHKAGGHGIQIFKPRSSEEDILKRIRAAENANAFAVGIDIDAASFITMKMKNQTVEPKSIKQLKKIISSTKLPFIIKGIMSPEDAEHALEAGASILYVSNHGGRVLDYMPSTVEVLARIREKVGKKAKIMIDGGFREGIDIFKGIALGADYIAIGRPAAIAAVGGGSKGIELQCAQWKEELSQIMLLTASGSIKEINKKKVYCPKE